VFELRTATSIGVLYLLVSLWACSNLSTIEVDRSNTEAFQYVRRDLREDVDSLVQPLIDQGVTPGAVVGVLLPGGHKRFFSYGVAERGQSRKPDAHTLFAIGSLSKGFLGAMTSILVQEGQLSWNDTLEKSLPPGTPLSATAKRITLLQLATHTSGLPRQPNTFTVFVSFMEYLFDGESFYGRFNRAYMLHYLATFDDPPHYQYSNVGYGLLGYVIELRTGLSLEALFKQTIGKPLGLLSTDYYPEFLPNYPMRARGYAGDQPKFIPRGTPVPDWKFTGLMKGSAGLYSTAEDLLTFASYNLKSDNTLLTAALKDTLKVRFVTDNGGAAIAWTVQNYDGQQIAYELGIVAGYTSYLGLDLRHGTAVVVLQNTFNWDESVGTRLLVRLGAAQDCKV
jgi:CubicO group peptidase (beta-lactamase class C family)